MKHVVMFSGGIGSWMTAKRVADLYGTDDLTLLFADTKMEDEDLYRFLEESAANVGGTLVKVAEGRDPWEVFFDVKFLGNSRIDPCSRVLKRQFLRKYIDENYDPEDTVIYIGIDWTEQHRMERAAGFWEPWKVVAPMCERPLLSKKDMIIQLELEGIKPPELYQYGFPHNNCGGFCIKAGQAQFRLLLKVYPERYCYHEQQEQKIRKKLGKDISILKDRRGGKVKPLTLKDFRERLDKSPNLFDENEWGGCGCFSP